MYKPSVGIKCTKGIKIEAGKNILNTKGQWISILNTMIQ